jgi:hypothetical protein
MINEIKNLKIGQSIIYHIGNLAYDASKYPEVKLLQAFIVDTLYKVVEYGRLEAREDCKYKTIQKKNKFTNGFEYHIERVK